MAGEYVTINGVQISSTTNLNNTGSVFNPESDYIYIGRLDSNGVLTDGFRARLTDIAEDFAGELLIDVMAAIDAGKVEIEELTASEKTALASYVNKDLKDALVAYEKTQEGVINSYVATSVLPSLDSLVSQAQSYRNEAQSAKADALSSKTASETALSSVESLKAQVETIAAGSAAGTITIDGILYTRALVFKNGIATITLTEVEETESA